MTGTRFKTPEKVNDMLRLLLDGRISRIEEVRTKDGLDLMVQVNGTEIGIHFIDDAMLYITFRCNGRKYPFGRIRAEAVTFVINNDDTFTMQTVLGAGGISIIMPKKPDACIRDITRKGR